MIKLIINEFIKFGKTKILLTQILFIIVTIVLYKLNYTKEIIYSYIPFVSIIISILFSGIINKEIEDGTLRYYLTKPFKRWKIYLSKSILTFIFSIIILITILLTFIFLYKSIELSYILKFIKYSIPMILMVNIVVFNSVIIRNTSISVGINIFFIIFGILISQILFGLKLTFFQYTFLPYLDYSIFDDLLTVESINNEFNISLSLKNGIIINIIYSIIFYILGNLLFIKKDINN